MQQFAKNGGNNGTPAPNKAAKNGTESLTATNPDHEAEMPSPKSDGQSPVPKVETQSDQQPKPLTVEGQREKAEKLNILFEREERLKDHQRNLNRFNLAADEDNNHFEIRDGKGVSFSTRNPGLIKVILDDVRNALVIGIAKVEADIVAIG